MFKRLFLPLVTLFWVVMNLWLWRSEMEHGPDGGSPVPLATVWEKILTAPDDSSLQILHQGRRVGFCRWTAKVGEATPPSKAGAADAELEGRVGRLSGYSLALEGSVSADPPLQRFRMSWRADFDTNQAWRTMSLRLLQRPTVLEVAADATAETVRLRLDDPQQGWERHFRFTDLRQPDQLLAALGLPVSLGWWQQIALPVAATNAAPALALGLQWEARRDWLKIGQANTRAYRLRLRLLDKYQAVVFVSRVGEILRVELPNDVVLVNESLAAW